MKHAQVNRMGQLKSLGSLIVHLGFDPRRLKFVRHLARFSSHYRTFRAMGGVVTKFEAIVSDYGEQAGSGSGQYFHQDLLVATYIHQANPRRHIDIGSRVDGFVAHVASFRPIEVLDIRELASTGHANIQFLRVDITNPENVRQAMADSISCLHAIEHFGLGRYGDSIDPHGYVKGFENLVNMTIPGGMLYISFPIGRSNAVHFNAQRVFKPLDIFSWSPVIELVELVRFDFVDEAGHLHRGANVNECADEMTVGCGIYSFRRKTAAQLAMGHKE